MKYDFPKTKEIHRKITVSTDLSRMQVKRNNIESDLELARNFLDKAEDRWDYDSISEDIKELQKELEEVELQIKFQPLVKQEMDSKEHRELLETFNKELKPYQERYTKLDKQLKKELNNFVSRIEDMVLEMEAIEKADREMLGMKIRSPYYTEFSGISPDKTTLEKEYSPYAIRISSLTTSVQELVKAIKKIK
jgi:DNA repair exonuclease SbcCD ATPase subunit